MKQVFTCKIESTIQGVVLGEVRITSLDEPGRWLIEAGRNGPTSIGLHSATFYHDAEEDNSLALLRAGLNSLEEWAFEGDNRTRHLARRLPRTREALQGWADRLRDH